MKMKQNPTLHNVVTNDVEMSGTDISTLHSIDAKSVPDIETTLRKYWTTLIQRCIKFAST